MGKLQKIVKIGDDLAVVIPEEVLAEMCVGIGDLVWIDKPVISPADFKDELSEEEFQHQMAVARQVMIKDRQALRALSKL